MNDLVAKFKALSMGSRIIVVAGAALIIIGFLPWYSIDLGPFGSASRNGWQSPGALWGVIAILLGIAMAAVIAVRNLGKAGTIPENLGGYSWPKINLAASVVAALAVVIKYLNDSDFVGFGFWLGFIAVAALVIGAFLDFQAERSGTQSSAAPQ